MDSALLEDSLSTCSYAPDCFLPVDSAVPLDRATSLLDLFGTTRHALLDPGRRCPSRSA